MAGSIIHRKRRKLKSEINVVPYIDVMLVLLIIFMVTAPLLTPERGRQAAVVDGEGGGDQERADHRHRLSGRPAWPEAAGRQGAADGRCGAARSDAGADQGRAGQ
jgi:hypothetical protein